VIWPEVNSPHDERAKASIPNLITAIFEKQTGPQNAPGEFKCGASGVRRCILLAGRGTFMAKAEVYIERREQGDYAVRRPGSERASAILPTQAQAIERAREMNPDAAVHVERVRDTNVGGRDRWRKL
jgi:hypothetical protein